MSSEKNPEVVGCDASIMRNVWEIRARDQELKLQLEQERMEKSALPSINQDWAGRLAARQGGYKRVERKPKPAQNQTDNNDIWKSKLPLVPPTLPRGAGSAPLGRVGGPARGFSTPAFNYKDRKGQDKSFKRLQLLVFIDQTQPSAMVWGKSWKYNKSLPVEDAEAKPIWGHCWMFATHQPYSEAGKPWLNGPNLMDPRNLRLWRKPHYKTVELEEFGLSTDEWQMAWRKSHKSNKEDASSINGEIDGKYGFFTTLVETQHYNEALCSSEWRESWRSTKPANQQDRYSGLNDSLMNVSIGTKQDKEKEISSKWEECWRLVNNYGCNKLPQVKKKSYNPEWVHSWRASMAVFNNHKNSVSSPKQEHGDDEHSHIHRVILVSREQKQRDLYLQLCNEFQTLCEWNKSWQVTKNNSKPCEEMEKILKASLPVRVETGFEAQKGINNPKGSPSERSDYEHLKHHVIYNPRRNFTQTKLLHVKYQENISEWRDSWKTLKHRMRMERRRMRPDPLRPFRPSEEGGDMRPTASEWNNSWKFTCRSLHQEPEHWQQRWTTMPQIRVDRAWDHNHFAPVELPKNGPTAERSWVESWRSSRHQRQSQPGQGRAQTNMSSHHLDNSHAQRRYGRSLSDWQAAWMVSETQFHHDRPSLTQWMEAWRGSIFQTEHSTEPRENGMDVHLEIQPMREIPLQRAKAKISQTFNNQVFRERYPEKQWNSSWRAGSLLKHQPSHCESSGTPRKSMSTQQQHTTENGHGSKWGRSFRIANPMPQMEQPWVKSSPNPCRYAAMWSKGKNMNMSIIFNCNPATLRLWGNSHRFLQGASAKIKNNTKSKEPVDPRVIITNKIKSRRHLYANIEKEKKTERTWTGCHQLGKTQPRPKRGVAPAKTLKMEDKTTDKFFEEWAESWRSSSKPGGLKKQLTVKSLSGWVESWKFLIPPYAPMNGPKAK